MEDKQILNLILEQLTEIKSELKEMKSDISDIKTIQAQHSEQIQIIKEQTARNAELETVVDELVKDVKKLKDDNVLIKRVLAN